MLDVLDGALSSQPPPSSKFPIPCALGCTVSQVSTLDIPSAAFRVKGFMRFVYHRKRMREEVRRQYSRFFDGRSKRHFYSFHRTGEVNIVPPEGINTCMMMSEVFEQLRSQFTQVWSRKRASSR